MHTARPRLHAIGNAHIDPVWLWRWPEGLETIRSTFRSALDRLNEYPGFVFTSSSAAFYEMLATAEPEMIDEIRERVREGRWEIVGGWWVQPDVNIPCGESLVRQALEGQRAFQSLFGVRATVGYNPDTFGHPAGLPQILNGAGIDSYAFLRPGPHEKEIPASVFRWQSPDGSEVIAARIARAYCTWPNELADQVASCEAARPEFLSDYIVFYGVGNHGGGPTRRNIESLLAMGAVTDGPIVTMGRLDAFFAAVRPQLNLLPLVPDELQHHARGCYTAHAGVKRWNRRSEQLLLAAERVGVLAGLRLDHAYPHEEMRRAWRDVLFNQFHDILAGTSLPEAYDDARDSYGEACAIAARALHGSLQRLTSRIHTAGITTPVVVANTLPWPVRLPVEMERGPSAITETSGAQVPVQMIEPTTTAGQRRCVFVADLPALGWRTFAAGDAPSAAEAEGELTVSPTLLENRWYRLEMDPDTGAPVRLLERSSGRELLAGPIEVVALDDDTDTWSHGIDTWDTEIGRFQGSPAVVEEAGAVRACLRTETALGASSAALRFYLYRDSPVIEMRVDLNWQEPRRMAKLAAPLAVGSPRALYATPYAVTERGVTGEEEPGQQWLAVESADDGAGVALLNDGVYGFDVRGAEIRATLVRTPAYAHHDPAKLDPAKRYRYIDMGEHHFAFRLVPYTGGWQAAGLDRRAAELNFAPICVNETQHAGPLAADCGHVSCSAETVVITAIKPGEQGDGFILRAHETSGRPTDATFSIGSAAVRWTAALPGYAIRSWRITPGAAASVEAVDLLEDAIG